MSGRRGLSPIEIVDVAIALVDAEGGSALTLSRVARELGVKPPSLYNHVATLDALRRDAGLRVVDEIGTALGAAVMGRSGPDALRSVATAFRTYVTAHPGRYELSTTARPDDEEFASASYRAIEPVVAILRGFDLNEQDAIHAARSIRAALHGFVSLEIVGGFGLDVDVDDSFDWLIDRLVETLQP